MAVIRACGFLGLLASLALSQPHFHHDGPSLINGTADTGLLTLSYEGRTGLVCAEGFGRLEAHVACRDLGLPAAFPSLTRANVTAGQPIVGSHVRCQGDEIKMADCRHDTWAEAGHADCPGGKVVALACPADPCSPSPCLNGGTCTKVTSDLGYACTCTAAWTGDRCTQDVNECLKDNAGCSHLCVDMEGGYSCQCPQAQLSLSPDNHTCSAPGEHVTCGSDVMEISFEKTHFPSLHREHLTLDDVSCLATENATHLILTAPLSACGTRSKLSGGVMSYNNTVHSLEEVVEGVISRVKHVLIPFRCAMALHEVQETPIAVDTGVLRFTLEAHAQHNVTLQLQSQTGGLLSAGGARVYPGEEIAGHVTLNTRDPTLNLTLANCSATPAWGNTSTTPYSVISNGCPADATLSLDNISADGRHHSFTLEAFKFLDNSPAVNLTCDVTLCDDADPQASCTPGCSRSTSI